MKPSRVVFCDFDGTITTQDTFVSMLEKFAPEIAQKLLPAIFKREISLKEGVHQTLGTISAMVYPEIIEYIACQPIRAGLLELLEFLDRHEVPFIVVSGGLTDMVNAVLKRQRLLEGVTAIYAGEVDTTGKLIRAYSIIESEDELVAKAKVMTKYPAQEKIAIGDSVTDINMSLAADLVFARDRLMQYLDTENKPYIQWDNFYDVQKHLSARWQIFG